MSVMEMEMAGLLATGVAEVVETEMATLEGLWEAQLEECWD